MTENEAKELCLALMGIDSEDEVIGLLRKAGYWDNQTVWRFYGDNENNYSTIGNQQSRPDAALVEKLVNSVDARLMNECLVRGMDPEDAKAPQSIQEAVALFFDNSTGAKTSLAGRIRDWTKKKRTEVALGITLAATGAIPTSSRDKKSNPCFTISDIGEGQTPVQMPQTLLSLKESNKLRIPFVQGKFNMGGSGVLEFCGIHNLQLIISRRNPAIVARQGAKHCDDDKWSFTIVRREDPVGNRKSSVYTYLAPIGTNDNPNKGDLLRITADAMPIFPEGKKPYAREFEWGTLIKLYEYAATWGRSNIIRKDGFLYRADLLLPDVALPIRFYECRDYKGHGGSFEETVSGLRVRLEGDEAEENKTDNLEESFPLPAFVRVAGDEMPISIYAFKKNRSEAYRKNEGIIFVVHGQTHGFLTTDFFTRKNVGLSYLSDSVLVIADCTELGKRAREMLFMPSRDRLRACDLRQQIEESLEELLKQHQGLRELKERRRREEIESKLDDAKPLEDILEKLLKLSPILSNLFLLGLRSSTPFKTVEVQAHEQVFKGQRFPTFFKFKSTEYGQQLSRDCHINMRCRLVFETDVENEYFSRAIDPGEFRLTEGGKDRESAVQNYVLNLQNGIATLSLPLPEKAVLGQYLRYIARTNDCSRMEPFTNEFCVIVKDEQQARGNSSDRRKPPSKEPGEERERHSGIQLPRIKEVVECEWQNKTPPFDKYTALRIINAGNGANDDGGSDSSAVYDFYINVDNLYLKSELKSTKIEPKLVQKQFIYGMVLIGLALLQQNIEDQRRQSDSEEDAESDNNDGVNIEKEVEQFCRAVAPVVIPMINSLGSLSLEEEPALGASGEAT